ncbi:protein AidB-like protein [Corchorus olitorius]|uniref:Protein AidB-like protein n=1 Tax=Corchorus olitorius TaxID=93759 RepID=A0A1R3KK94_9ROSI|nr:protein AidB-like protein [Corchorus olitorius]
MEGRRRGWAKVFSEFRNLGESRMDRDRNPPTVEDEDADAERVEEVVGQPVPSSFEHLDPAYSEDSSWYDAAPATPITKGRDGRFVSTGSSSDMLDSHF